MTGRLFLIHWDQNELEQLAEPLRQAGWQVEGESADGARASKAILADPPDVLVIYLTRLPSHGRETADYLRTKLNADQLPILFVAGAPEKVEKVRAKVPQARYLGSEELPQALAELR